MAARRKKRRKPLRQLLPDLWKIYQYFGKEIRSQRWLVGKSMSILLIAVACRLLEPWPLKFIIDYAFQSIATANGTTSETQPSPALLVSLVAASIILIAAMRAYAEYRSKVGFFQIGNQVVIQVRGRVFRHLLNLTIPYHDQARQGDLITRVTRDVSLLRDVSATAILPLIASSLMMLGMTTAMLIINWKLAAVALAIVPLYWLTNVRLGRQIRKSARKQRERESAMAAIASESIHAIRAIKTMRMEEKFASQFDRKNGQSQADDLKSSRLSLQLGRTVDILLALATAAVMWFGATDVLAGRMLPGDLVVFLVYLKRSFKPAQEFAKYTARIAKAIAAGERVIAVLNTPGEVESERPLDSLASSHVARRVEFDRVRFGYSSDQLVLKNFSLSVDAGETVAIVGPSGAGKSTLISLLLRFYEPQSGEIRIDDRNLRDLGLQQLREQFSAVLQNPMLFSGTIAENIAAGSPAADQQEVLAAARLAEVDEFAFQQPEGLGTRIGERATSLSRGQQQRVAIARAALTERGVLLLDEPTTGLDESNFSIVADALFELGRDKTVVLVTHDLRLATRADRVLYLSGGEILEQGTHQELMDRDGRYAQDFRQQRESGISPDSSPSSLITSRPERQS